MSRKNRKISQAANHVPAKTILLIAVAALVAIAYLGLQSRNDELGREIKALERSLPGLAKNLASEERNWTAAKSIPNMKRLIDRYDIKMDWPAESQIIRLVPDPDNASPYQLHASR